MSFRLLIFTTVAAVVLLPLASCGKDYNESNSWNELNMATADCQDLGNKLWPQAKAGNSSARDALGDLVRTRGLRVPGQPTDSHWMDTYLTLIVHEDMMKSDMNSKFKLLGSDSVKQPAGSNLAHCFSVRWSMFGNAAQRSCVDESVEQGLIINFKDFVQSVDEHLQHGKEFFCVNQTVGKGV